LWRKRYWKISQNLVIPSTILLTYADVAYRLRDLFRHLRNRSGASQIKQALHDLRFVLRHQFALIQEHDSAESLDFILSQLRHPNSLIPMAAKIYKYHCDGCGTWGTSTMRFGVHGMDEEVVTLNLAGIDTNSIINVTERIKALSDSMDENLRCGTCNQPVTVTAICIFLY
jgi:hypothetical protein